MIKNIVFDMGNVLVKYDADRVCEHFIADQAVRDRIKTAVFVSPEWVLLDMGVIDKVTEQGAKLIGMSINVCLQSDISERDLYALVG